MAARSSLLALLALLFAPALAPASPYTNLVVFGDSLSDQGNAFFAVSPNLPGGATYPPYPYPQVTPGQSTPYYNDRFSNGPNWVDIFSAKLGLSSTPYVLGGTNYAFGGAATSGLTGYGTPSLGVQVGLYLTGPYHTTASTSLFALWGGANDFLLGGQTNPAIPANNIKSDIQALYAAGGRDFLVFNLPALGDTPLGLGNTPFSPNQEAGLNALTVGFNAQLEADLEQLEQMYPDIQIHRVDVYNLFQELLANPAAFGFDPALTGYDPVDYWAFVLGGDPNNLPNGAGYIFWDAVHPTTQADALIAQAAFDALPEPSTLSLFLLAAGGLWVGRRFLPRKQLASY